MGCPTTTCQSACVAAPPCSRASEGPSWPPWYDESRPILASLTYLEQRDGVPVDGEALASFLLLRSTWGPRWRQRLGSLLRQYEREGRLRRVAPRDRRASDPRGTPARVPGGWSVRGTAQQQEQNVDAHKRQNRNTGSRRAA